MVYLVILQQQFIQSKIAYIKHDTIKLTLIVEQNPFLKALNTLLTFYRTPKVKYIQN